MKWCRFQIGAQVSHGIVEDDTVIEVTGSPFGEHSLTRTTHRLDRVKLLAPRATTSSCRGNLRGPSSRRGSSRS